MRTTLLRMALALTVATIVTAFAAAPAYADPITVTSGNINFITFDSVSVGLDGTNAELTAQLGGAGAVPPYASCGSSSTGGSCAGQTLNLSVNGAFGATTLEGGAIVDGIKYTLNSFLFDISAGDVVAPAMGSVTSPFTFHATTMGMTPGGLSNTFQFTGSGLATAQFGPNGWSLTNYTFANTAGSPTPEPASLLLLGTGIAAVCGRRRRAATSR